VPERAEPLAARVTGRRLRDRLESWANIDPHLVEVMRDGTIAFVLKIFGSGCLFVFTVLVSRSFGPSGAGVFFLALTIMMAAVAIGTMGLDTALLRFSAASAAHEQWDRLRALYTTGIRLCLLSSAVVAVALALSAGWLASVVFSKPLLATPLRVIAIGIVPTSVFTVQAQVLKGLKRIREGVFFESAAVALFAIPLFVTLRLAHWGSGAATTAYVGATLLAVVAAAWCVHHFAPPWGSRLRLDRPQRRLLLKTSFPLLVVSGMSLVMSSTGVALLGVFRDTRTVGIYAAAARTAVLISWVLVSANAVVAPKFAALYAAGDMDAFVHVARRTARAATLLVLPPFLCLMVAPSLVLRLFGPDFRSGATALIIMSVGQLVNVATGSVGYILMMTGNERSMRDATIVAGLLNVVLQVIFIPAFGLLGAAVATAISLATLNVLSAALVFRRLGVVIWPLPYRPPLAKTA